MLTVFASRKQRACPSEQTLDPFDIVFVQAVAGPGPFRFPQSCFSLSRKRRQPSSIHSCFIENLPGSTERQYRGRENTPVRRTSRCADPHTGTAILFQVVVYATAQWACDGLLGCRVSENATEVNVPFRKASTGVIWHWCHNCSAWPLSDFRQREDKPGTWSGESLCLECAASDSCRTCQHSLVLRTGLSSDAVLGTVLGGP